MRARSKASASSGQPSSWAASAGASKDSLQVPCRRLLAFQLADPCTPCFLGGVNETACAVMRPYTSRCASGESQNINSKFRPWLVANTRCYATRVMQSARPSRILALRGRTIVLARLLRRTECKTQLVPPTAAPNHHPNPLSFSAVSNRGPGPEAKSVARKRCRASARRRPVSRAGARTRSCTRKRS